jgi:hypothetical protein
VRSGKTSVRKVRTALPQCRKRECGEPNARARDSERRRGRKTESTHLIRYYALLGMMAGLYTYGVPILASPSL